MGRIVPTPSSRRPTRRRWSCLDTARKNGRYPLLDRVIKPAVSITQLRATSPSVSTVNTSWAQPSGSSQDAYIKLVEIHRLECEQHAEKVRAYEEHNRMLMTVSFAPLRANINIALLFLLTFVFAWSTNMKNMYLAIQTGAALPPMGPPPPLPGPYRRIPSFEEFVALGNGTPGTYGSSVGGGTAGGATPGS